MTAPPTTEATGIQAIPKGAKLVKIGREYRIVWALGDGLGHAWYSPGSWENLKKIFGEVAVVNDELQNLDQFKQKYGNQYWGDIREVDLKAETPWQDLRQRIYNQFGFVPGMDTPEVRRMLTQAFFEKWTTEQFQVEYRKTSAFKTTTDQQRRWVGLSAREQQAQVTDERTRLANLYRDIFGSEPQMGWLETPARRIASGQQSAAEWEYQQRQRAAKIAGTPEFARRQQQQADANAAVNQRENMALAAEQQYRAWVGPGAIPQNWAKTWGVDLATGKKSEADLEKYLKTLAQSRWALKPPDLTWEDWAAGYKAQIGETLELGSVDDRDPLLNKILRSDLNGVDLEAMIRGDQRFRSTQKMFSEMSQLATDMGQRFGFIT